MCIMFQCLLAIQCKNVLQSDFEMNLTFKYVWTSSKIFYIQNFKMEGQWLKMYNTWRGWQSSKIKGVQKGCIILSLFHQWLL
jgi:hypothetical protein